MMIDSIPSVAPATENDRWHGAIDGLHDRLLVGWAFDSQRPDARVVVEVTLDGIPCACITADVARTDLAERLKALASESDLCHGFVADLSALPTGSTGILSAHVANTDIELAGFTPFNEAKSPPPAVLNSVIADGGLRLFGWALDPADPRRTLTVRAFVGNDMVATAAANIVHPSARAYVDGAHGFDLALPSSLADGRSHEVRVVDENGSPLNGSPVIVCCTLDGLTALLPKDTDELTVKVASIYERLVPRSLPMQAWPEWTVRFDSDLPEPLPASVASLTAGIIITGSSEEPDQKRRTLQCVQQQQGVAVQTFASESFASSLAEAIAAGCHVIGVVRAGDTLAPNALAYAMEGFALAGSEIVYTDSEHAGQPWFKPAWNADYALASDYLLELMLVRTTVATALADVANQADFAWAALAHVWASGADAVVHVPRVLYRMTHPLTEFEHATRAAAARRAIGILEPNVSLLPMNNVPRGATHAARRVHAALPDSAKVLTVSLVIPTRDRADLLRRCISSITKFTQWPNLEIIIIDNGSVETVTHEYFAELSERGVRVLPMPGPFNYADLNNRAVAMANGDIIGLINNDIEALHDGWLDEILAQLLRPGVGAVGAKLLWPNGMVQHGGVLMGVGNVAGHFGNMLADADWGDHGRNQLVHRVTGCTAACLFVHKRDYLDLEGMDAHAFPVAFNDVDLCLKIRATGKAIIWTPHAKLLHAESASRGHEDTPPKRARAIREIEQLRRRWGFMLLEDPTYHPSMNLDPNSHAFNGLACPPRPRQARKNSFSLDLNK
jgi:GT2 family glycosyltransferase